MQDRTQFSDADLVQLKRYWDRGMTSLGSVCREKIAAAANQLSVDTEIVKVSRPAVRLSTLSSFCYTCPSIVSSSLSCPVRPKG